MIKIVRRILLSSLLVAAAPVIGGVIDIGAHDGFGTTYATPLHDVCYNPDQDEYFVVHAGRPGGVATLLGQRVNAATGALIGESLALARISEMSPPYWDGFSAPAVEYATGRNRYMVTFRWKAARSMSWAAGKILDGTGTPLTSVFYLDGKVEEVGGGNTPADIAFDGTNFMAVWTGFDTENNSGPGLVARAFSPEGDPIADFAFIDSDAGWAPAIAYLPPAGRHLVAYRRKSAPGLVCRSLSADLTAGPARLLHGSAGTAWPKIAANPVGNEWLVAWEVSNTIQWAGRTAEGTPALTAGDIFFRRVGPDGTPLAGAVAIQDGSEIDLSPAVAWSSNHYIIHWQRGAAGSAGILGVKIDGVTGTMIQNGEAVMTRGFESVGPCLAARRGVSEMLSVWSNGIDVQAVRYRSVNAPPAPPSAAAQWQVDGESRILAGGTTRGDTVVMTAGVSDGDADAVALEVEVKRADADAGFDGTGTITGAEVASGSRASVTVPGLAIGAAYHWRIRGVSSASPAEPSTWVDGSSFIAQNNSLPAAGSPSQHDPATLAILVTGQARIDSEGLLLRLEGSDPDGDPVQLQVEVRPVGEIFTGEPTASGPFVRVGTAEVLIRNLGTGSYAWRGRLADRFGGRGAWRSYGANGDDQADFRLVDDGSLNDSKCQGSAAHGIGRIALFLIPFLAGVRSRNPGARRKRNALRAPL